MSWLCQMPCFQTLTELVLTEAHGEGTVTDVTLDDEPAEQVHWRAAIPTIEAVWELKMASTEGFLELGPCPHS